MFTCLARHTTLPALQLHSESSLRTAHPTPRQYKRDSPHRHPQTGCSPSGFLRRQARRRGSSNAEFRFPANLVGDRSLAITTDTPLGSTETTETIHLENKARYCSRRKSRSISHRRQSTFAHSRSTAPITAPRPRARSPLSLKTRAATVSYRKATKTDSFGVASAEFVLADEVNLGAWHLHASNAVRRRSAEQHRRTHAPGQRYVLPKFRVSINFAQIDSKPQRDFRPGDHVTGTVEAKLLRQTREQRNH